MKIRSAQKSDLTKILELNEAALPHVSKVQITDMARFLKQADPFLVIEYDNEVAGFMIVLQSGLDYSSLNYAFFVNHFENFDYVDRIVIADPYKGKKLGTSLYDHLFKTTDKKFITCEVNVKPANPASLTFHNKLGFNQVAEQVTENGHKIVSMLVKQM
ncbi:GNAT family N-acetyltransferase [Gracilimonas sp. Q87]|uniref:GNAT family N-acetyltransferase n=1 Tax=Gracilimonas sp. Q87 TaxID=3384766 RepID=UPI0039844C68